MTEEVKFTRGNDRINQLAQRPDIAADVAGLLPNAQLAIYPDAGHGGIFQYHALFVQQVLDLLRD